MLCYTFKRIMGLMQQALGKALSCIMEEVRLDVQLSLFQVLDEWICY